MPFNLSAQHLAAVNRRRRVVVNRDAIHGDPTFTDPDIRDLVDYKFDFIDHYPTHIDSLWWNWGEGHQAPYPSKILPHYAQTYDHPGYQRWLDEGIDPVRIFLEETRKRKLEAFFAYRINGGDNDLHLLPTRQISLKASHPDWLIHLPWRDSGMWNFAIEGVRDYKLSILREVAENYDFDGIDIDFARAPPVLPPGRQWQLRHHLTEFMGELRSMLLEFERKRNRPFLLSARVPETVEGAHFDGLDVETWAREQIVDLLALGVRSFEVDIEGYRSFTRQRNIKLYPSLDDWHSSDGYQWPPIEVFRGIFANWWRQGADGIHTFNFSYGRSEVADRIGVPFPDPVVHVWRSAQWSKTPVWETHLQAYREMGIPAALRERDKTFVMQRRGGGGHPSLEPDKWHTPRYFYANSNMMAQLPADLANDGKADTLLRLEVADDPGRRPDRLKDLDLRILLSDPAAQSLPDPQKLERTFVKRFMQARIRARKAQPPGSYYNLPPQKGVDREIEVRLNGALLAQPVIEEGWLKFRPRGTQVVAGTNLLGIRRTRPVADTQPRMKVEKVELTVRYR